MITSTFVYQAADAGIDSTRFITIYNQGVPLNSRRFLNCLLNRLPQTPDSPKNGKQFGRVATPESCKAASLNDLA